MVTTDYLRGRIFIIFTYILCILLVKKQIVIHVRNAPILGVTHNNLVIGILLFKDGLRQIQSRALFVA